MECRLSCRSGNTSTLTLDRFRWAALQLEAIKKLRPMNPQAITKTLHSLPKDLDDTYESILSKITAEETLTALRWIAFATRPLLIEELIDACAIKYSESSNIDQQFDRQNKFTPSDILDLLPGLVAVDPPLQEFESFLPGVHIVTFAHFSVQEYLLGERIKSGLAKMYSLEPQLSNHALARDCLAYLRCCNSFSLRTATYPLRGYAWDYWAWHAQFETSKPHDQIGTDAQAFFKFIAYQKSANGEASFDHLLSLLSDVAAWHAMPESAKLELRDCLSIPFFYNEFDISTWLGSSNSNSSPRQYEYQPLRLDRQEIRLVELFPSPKPFTEIRCKMLTVSLVDKPQFDALSYVWGDPLRVGYIRMDGLLLQIPTNLIDVLRNFRGKGNKDKRVLFADAICFDRHVFAEEQLAVEDLHIMMSPRMSSEREARFQLTPRIFKAAQQVAIGLGERDDADAKAIEFVREIASKPIEKSKDGQETKGPPTASYDAELGPSILRLFQRKWWLRSWPIQELILPLRATLYYGDIAVTFETFQKFFQMENELQKYLDAGSYDALATSKAWIGAKRVSMIRSEYAQGRIPPLPELLWATQLHEARRARDKIYALLGLLSLEQEESERLVIRYSSEIDLFTQVATYILARNTTVDILSYASCHPFQNSKPKDYCPSWVPNFAIAQTIPPLICGSFGPHDHEDLYNAGKQHGPPEVEVSKDSKSLQVKGFRIDAIEALYNTFADETNTNVLDRYTSLVQVRSSMKRPSGQSSLEAYWRSIHLDQWEGRRLTRDIQALVKNRLVTVEGATELAQTNELFDLQYCRGRRLFLTRLGYLGLGPANLKIGDLVTVLPGGKVPYILRQHGDNYTLIGEGFVRLPHHLTYY